MIDRSREEVATAMIPNHLIIDNCQWSTATSVRTHRAVSSRTDHANNEDTCRLDSSGTIVSRDLRDGTILFSKYSSYFRSGECVSFNLNLINPPYACPRWKTESIYSVYRTKKNKKRNINRKRRNMKKIANVRGKRVIANRLMKKREKKKTGYENEYESVYCPLSGCLR